MQLPLLRYYFAYLECQVRKSSAEKLKRKIDYLFFWPGNLLTIIALLKCERLRKHATTSFLLSLTFSDLLFCAIMMPLQAVRYYYRAWTFGDFLCQVFPFVFYSNVCVSMLSMILMTINRYILITFQHLYPKIYTTKMIIVQLFFAWFIAFLIMVSECVIMLCNSHSRCASNE
jgi:protein trapped in endoderm-1